MGETTSGFAANAAKYTSSAVHSDSAELDRLFKLVSPIADDRVLDIATGAGHVAMRFAQSVREVVALDWTSPMLAELKHSAHRNGLHNILPVLGDALAVPLASNAFHVVTMRLAAHHFSELRQFVWESKRVLLAGGKILLADTAVPEDPELDREINEIEILRDPSHVRNYRYSEWRFALEAEGFQILHEDHAQNWVSEIGTGMSLEKWMDRINTAPAAREELRRRFREASPPLRQALLIHQVGSDFGFSLPRTTLVGLKRS